MDKSEDKNQASPVPPAADGAAPAALSARRRLLRGGLLGAPALLALKSSPVLACNCKAPSGFSVSGNLSQTRSNNCADRGKKPSEWTAVTDTTTYTGTNLTRTTWFNAYFNLGSYGNKQFKTLLSQTSLNLDPQALVVAVLLESIASGNSVTGSKYPSVKNVQDMWNLTFATTAGYRPVSSMPNLVWQKGEVTQYLLYLTGQAPAV